MWNISKICKENCFILEQFTIVNSKTLVFMDNIKSRPNLSYSEWIGIEWLWTHPPKIFMNRSRKALKLQSRLLLKMIFPHLSCKIFSTSFLQNICWGTSKWLNKESALYWNKVNWIVFFFLVVYNYLEKQEKKMYALSGVCPVATVKVQYSSKTQEFTYLLYSSYRFGKVPLTATSDPGQKNVPAFRPWYIAVSQICRRTIAIVSAAHWISWVTARSPTTLASSAPFSKIKN